MTEDEAQRLKALEQENSRLKKIAAEQALDISMLKESAAGNGQRGGGRRWRYLRHRFQVSERRACLVVGQHRSTQWHVIRPAEFELG